MGCKSRHTHTNKQKMQTRTALEVPSEDAVVHRGLLPVVVLAPKQEELAAGLFGGVGWGLRGFGLGMSVRDGKGCKGGTGRGRLTDSRVVPNPNSHPINVLGQRGEAEVGPRGGLRALRDADGRLDRLLGADLCMWSVGWLIEGVIGFEGGGGGAAQ